MGSVGEASKVSCGFFFVGFVMLVLYYFYDFEFSNEK
jgi:hypothetical protein